MSNPMQVLKEWVELLGKISRGEMESLSEEWEFLLEKNFVKRVVKGELTDRGESVRKAVREKSPMLDMIKERYSEAVKIMAKWVEGQELTKEDKAVLEREGLIEDKDRFRLTKRGKILAKHITSAALLLEERTK